MANFDFTSGINSRLAGYVHTAAIAAMQGFALSQDADQYADGEMSRMAYRVACDYVRDCENVRRYGLTNIPQDKYPLVFKHALTCLTGLASGHEIGYSLDGMSKRALRDAAEFVRIGDLVNEDLRGGV